MLSSAVSWSNSQPPRAAAMNARVRLAHALGLAGRARRVEHDRHVVGRALRDLAVEEARMRAIEFAADLLQPLEARHVLVVAQAARIVVVDVRERRDLRHRLQHLVDLLLVLDDRVGDLRVVQHEDELGRGRVLVHRHRDAAQRLRRQHRPVEPRPVVADDREVHAALEALRGEAAGERAHLVRDLAPRPGLPDAEVLLAAGRMRGAHLRVVQQKTRKRIRQGSRGQVCQRLTLLSAGRPGPAREARGSSAPGICRVDSIGSPRAPIRRGMLTGGNVTSIIAPVRTLPMRRGIDMSDSARSRDLAA